MISKFLIDADLPKDAGAVLRRAGHDAVDIRDLGLAAACDADIASAARLEKRMLLTTDFDFADVRNYPPDQYAGIIVLTLRPSDTRDSILAIIAALAARTDLLARVPGRLAVVDHHHVRLRPRLT